MLLSLLTRTVLKFVLPSSLCPIKSYWRLRSCLDVPIRSLKSTDLITYSIRQWFSHIFTSGFLYTLKIVEDLELLCIWIVSINIYLLEIKTGKSKFINHFKITNALHVNIILFSKTKKKWMRRVSIFTVMQNFLVSDFMEDSWISPSESVFSLLSCCFGWSLYRKFGLTYM